MQTRYPRHCKRLLIAGVYAYVVLILAGCASTPMSEQILSQPTPSLPPAVELIHTPFFSQDEFQCGPAALATVLGATGIEVTPETLSPKVYLPGRLGTLQVELLAATRRYGRLPYLLEASLQTLLHEVKAGRPVLVLQNLGVSWIPRWHYAVVVGFDLQQQKLILRSGTIKRYNIDMALFERTWQRSQHWAVLVLKPGELPVGGSESSYFQTVADFENNQASPASIIAYQAGLRRWPESRPLGMGLGNAFYQTGKRISASQSFQQVIAHHPDYAPAHNNLAQVLLELGQLQAAKRHALRALSLGGSHQQDYQSTLDAINARAASR